MWELIALSLCVYLILLGGWFHPLLVAPAGQLLPHDRRGRRAIAERGWRTAHMHVSMSEPTSVRCCTIV